MEKSVYNEGHVEYTYKVRWYHKILFGFLFLCVVAIVAAVALYIVYAATLITLFRPWLIPIILGIVGLSWLVGHFVIKDS